MAQPGSPGSILPVFQEHRFHAWVVLEDANQFRAAIAPVPEYADPFFHD